VTVIEVIKRGTEFLARKGVESPRLQVELLLASVLNLPRLKLYIEFERVLAEQELEQTRELLKRRARREPLQHILGSTSFCGFEIKVNRSVLIPRQETELLAERAWAFLKNRAKETPAPVALDFGTGSGCLAITLACHVPAARIYALDISRAALDLARENAVIHHAHEQIEFIESDGLAGLPANLQFDLVVSNPPYIPSPEIDSLPPEVRDFDPRSALDGGECGLTFYSLLARQIPERLKSDGELMCEFGDGQADAVLGLFQRQGWRIEGIEQDLAGRARFLIACRPES
jgi:release factor glutamine methyltransferase